MIEHMEHNICCGETDDKKAESLSENLKTLRDEARELKECFNRQCFQAIAVISLFFIYLFHFMFHSEHSEPIKIDYSIGIAAYISILLIITVLNVGIYKFEGANRIIGYILFLERSSLFKEQKFNKSIIINWESLIKAWRVFHPTVENALYIRWSRSDRRNLSKAIKNKNMGLIFNSIKNYIYAQFNKGKLRREYKDGCIYRWYLPELLVHSEGEYSPGNYLRRMMFMMHLLGGIAYLLVFLATFFGNFEINIRVLLMFFFFICSYFIFIYMIYRPYNLSKRIEKGLFCIHSTSIFWSVVSKAHERTLLIINGENNLKHYSFILSCLALHFAEFGVDRAHEWCSDSENKDIAEYIKDKKLSDYPPKLQNIFDKKLELFCKVSQK